MTKYKLDEPLDISGKYKNKTPREVIEKKRTDILVLIKNGIQFDDEVLKLARIKKTERDHKCTNEFDKHVNEKKTYKKDTASLEEIEKSILTIDQESYKGVVDDDVIENDEQEDKETNNE